MSGSAPTSSLGCCLLAGGGLVSAGQLVSPDPESQCAGHPAVWQGPTHRPRPVPAQASGISVPICGGGSRSGWDRGHGMAVAGPGANQLLECA